MIPRKVRVTQHCKVRAEQRLKLYLKPYELDNLEFFIRKEFKTARRCPKIANVPFYKNKLGCEVFITDFVKFYCKEKDNVVTILTVIKNRGEWRF
jgi:hypothetical protein